MIRKRYTLSIAILLVTMTTIAGDWVQWWHMTPGHNEISNQSFNDVNRNLFVCNGAGRPLIQFIDKWYFYKGYVIGTLEPNQPNQFFIINEQECTIDTFNNSNAFEVQLSQNRLKPIFWTRWYTSNWGCIFVGKGYGGYWDFFFFRGTWLLLPLTVLAIFYVIQKPVKEHFKWGLCLVFIILILIRIVLDIVPESV